MALAPDLVCLVSLATALTARGIGSTSCTAGESCVAARDSSLLQAHRRLSRKAIGKDTKCEMGDVMECPDDSGAWCGGKSCCPGKRGERSYPCPSAPPGWGLGSCQNTTKRTDCLRSGSGTGDLTTGGVSVPAHNGNPPRGKVRLLSFNVWWGNHNFKAIADLIQNEVDPDIVNLQEAVLQQPLAIIRALNAVGTGKWSLANQFGLQHYWCGLNAYRSDKWELEWTKELTFQHDRGICGARLRRKSDDVEICVWGTHPVWRTGAPAQFAQEAVRTAAAAMHECSRGRTPSALLCDCNTDDSAGVVRQLEASTGWSWGVAHADGYDHIYIETAPQKAGVPSGGTTIEPSGRRGCQGACQNANWAGSDHPPVYVDLSPE